MKISSPILTSILYLMILVASLILFFSFYEETTNGYFDNFAKLFYLHIGLCFIIGLLTKKPFKVIFFILTLFLVCALVVSIFIHAILLGMAKGYSN